MRSYGAFHEFVSFSHNLNAEVFKTDFFKKPITVGEGSGIKSAFILNHKRNKRHKRNSQKAFVPFCGSINRMWLKTLFFLQISISTYYIDHIAHVYYVPICLDKILIVFFILSKYILKMALLDKNLTRPF